MTGQHHAQPRQLAYECSGDGSPLLLVHGWPFHRGTFRKVVPYLAKHFTCYSVDSAGMGGSGYARGEDLGFEAHADRLYEFARARGLQRFSVVGHDTGGSIARVLAAKHPASVERLVLIDTETPGHLPEIVPRYQRLLSHAVARWLFRRLLSSTRFARSSHGFAGCFHDPAALTIEFADLFCAYWARSTERFEGLIAYLMAIEHDFVERMDELHARIEAPALLVWGRHDRIFPLALAERMASHMASCKGLEIIENAGFLPQEEQPEKLAKHIVGFLR